MNMKEIRVQYDEAKAEFLVLCYKDGILHWWEIVNDSKEVQNLISLTYFPD